MYLTQLNVFRPGPQHWPSNLGCSASTLDTLFTYADAEFNSASWAHQEFSAMQPIDRVQPSAYLHRSWSHQVMAVAANNFGPMCAPGAYGCECVAWALIDMWIKMRLIESTVQDLPETLRSMALTLRMGVAKQL
jgi:hypothetical protein